jgi:hypothetical protein
MDDIDHEVSCLALADKRINDGRRRVLAQAERVRNLRAKGLDAVSAEQLLSVMRQVLENFLEARQLMERSLQLRGSSSGKLHPTTDKLRSHFRKNAR